MSIEATCEKLGCKRRQIFYLLASGKLEAAPRVGRSLRIYAQSVDRLLAHPTDTPRSRRTRSPAGFELSDIPV